MEKKRYKAYAEPGNINMPLPTTTKWRLHHGDLNQGTSDHAHEASDGPDHVEQPAGDLDERNTITSGRSECVGHGEAGKSQEYERLNMPSSPAVSLSSSTSEENSSVSDGSGKSGRSQSSHEEDESEGDIVTEGDPMAVHAFRPLHQSAKHQSETLANADSECDTTDSHHDNYSSHDDDTDNESSSTGEENEHEEDHPGADIGSPFSDDEDDGLGVQDGEDGDDPRPPPPVASQPLPAVVAHQYLRQKLLGPYAERIIDPPAAKRGEILLNIQEFCAQHPLPLAAQEDLHRLINSIFHKEIIPETTFKLDQLFSTANNIKHFFFCGECSTEFGELDYKHIRTKVCPECDFENNVGDRSKATYFITIDFVQQLQLLLEDLGVASKLKNPELLVNNGDILKDLYDGQVYKDFIASLDFRPDVQYMSITACTDGTPLFKSSTLSIWPIFSIINELPPDVRMSNVLLCGLWFGKKHPKMDLFLQPFCDQIQELSTVGCQLTVLNQVKVFKIFLIGMCVDSGARGSVQCVHSIAGAFSCNWCLHPGEIEGDGSNARKFLPLDQEPAKRTPHQMIRDGREVLDLPGKDRHVNGVLGISPLLRCPKFNIVDGMVLDHLPWAAFGVARRMGKLWLGETKKKKKEKIKDNPLPYVALPGYYVGTEETKLVINRRIRKLRPPFEVRRFPRDLSQVMNFNAREWESFILYFSIPLFIHILPGCFMKHWVLFVQAFYLLMKANLLKTDIDVAEVLMQRYVNEVLDLYGRKEMTFNMHISVHAAENARRWAAGWCVSTYAFENGNKILKSKIHAEKGIPQQVVRSLDRDSSLRILRSLSSTSQSDSFRSRMNRKTVKKFFYADAIACIMPSLFIPSEEEHDNCNRRGVPVNGFMECRRIIISNVCYGLDTGSKTNNSYAFCSNQTIVKIRKIIASERSGEVYLFVSQVRCSPYPLPRLDINVPFTPFMYTVDLLERGISLISSSDLETVCVHSKVDCQFYKGEFVSVMPYTMNVY